MMEKVEVEYEVAKELVESGLIELEVSIVNSRLFDTNVAKDKDDGIYDVAEARRKRELELKNIRTVKTNLRSQAPK